MGPDRVVVRGVRLENVAQIRFAEHDQVIEVFAPDRADEPLDVALLPSRTLGRRMIANSYRPNAPVIDRAKGSVPSRSRCRGASSHGKASLTWPAIHWAV